MNVFLHISKAFDKIWHQGLIFKLSKNDISGNLLDILCDFLSDRKQTVVPNGQKYTWENVNAIIYIQGYLVHFLRPSLKKKKILSKKSFYIFFYFGRCNFLALVLKNFLYFLKRKLFLYFRKWKPTKASFR